MFLALFIATALRAVESASQLHPTSFKWHLSVFRIDAISEIRGDMCIGTISVLSQFKFELFKSVFTYILWLYLIVVFFCICQYVMLLL